MNPDTASEEPTTPSSQEDQSQSDTVKYLKAIRALRAVYDDDKALHALTKFEKNFVSSYCRMTKRQHEIVQEILTKAENHYTTLPR